LTLSPAAPEQQVKAVMAMLAERDVLRDRS
jgi:hypothetical protein